MHPSQYTPKISYSSWPKERMEVHLELYNRMVPEHEGIYISEDEFYAAVFLLGLELCNYDGWEYFVFNDKTFYNRDIAEERENSGD